MSVDVILLCLSTSYSKLTNTWRKGRFFTCLPRVWAFLWLLPFKHSLHFTFQTWFTPEKLDILRYMWVFWKDLVAMCS